MIYCDLNGNELEKYASFYANIEWSPILVELQAL